MRHVAQRGFGLFEALVALTVLAIAGGALFEWLGQNLLTASRLRDREQRVQIQLLAEGLVSAVNPALESEGRILGAGLQVNWRAELVSPERESVPYEATTSPKWRVGLYKLHVSARATSDTTPGEVNFELLQTGLRPFAVLTHKPDSAAP